MATDNFAAAFDTAGVEMDYSAEGTFGKTALTIGQSDVDLRVVVNNNLGSVTVDGNTDPIFDRVKVGDMMTLSGFTGGNTVNNGTFEVNSVNNARTQVQLARTAGNWLRVNSEDAGTTSWGITPYQRLRLTSEEFASTKTRTRPAEINADGQASQALTTQVEATGSLGFGLSAETYDDFLVAAINGAYFEPRVEYRQANNAEQYTVAAGSVAGTHTIVSDRNSTDWQALGFLAGRYIYIRGSMKEDLNGVWRLIGVATGSLTIHGSGRTLAAGQEDTGARTEITMGGRTRNGVNITTFNVIKGLGEDSGGDDLLLGYPGSYINEMTLDVAIGGFVSGSFEFLASKEQKLADHPAASGTLRDAPSGRIIDTVSGVRQFAYNNQQLDGTLYDTILQSMSLTVSKEGARSQYGIGSSDSRGLGRGTLSVSGDFSTYFRNFALYDLFVSESGGIFEIVLQDDQGEGYVFTLPNVTLVNPSITAGGPDTDLVAEFELEGNPGALITGDDPFTIQIDRIVRR